MTDQDVRALPAPDDTPEEGPMNLPQREPLVCDLNSLLAATLCMSGDDTRPYLNGIYVHVRDGKARIASTDGTSMFVTAMPYTVDGTPPPSWGERGVILHRENLRDKLALIRKLGATQATLAWAPGHPKAQLRSRAAGIEMEVEVYEGTFPDYQQAINGVRLKGAGDIPVDAKPEAIDATTFNRQSMQLVNKVLADVYHGADKGTHHMTQIASEKGPQLFGFPNAGETFLLLMPMNTVGGLDIMQKSGVTQGVIAGSAASLGVAVRAHKAAARKDKSKAGVFHALAAQLEARRKALEETLAIAAPAEEQPAEEEPAAEAAAETIEEGPVDSRDIEHEAEDAPKVRRGSKKTPRDGKGRIVSKKKAACEVHA